MDAILGNTGCGDGYCLDQVRIWSEITSFELAAERQVFAGYRGNTDTYK